MHVLPLDEIDVATRAPLSDPLGSLIDARFESKLSFQLRLFFSHLNCQLLLFPKLLGLN